MEQDYVVVGRSLPRNHVTCRKSYIAKRPHTTHSSWFEKLSMPSPTDDEDLKLLYVLMQPTRQKIIRLLRSSKEPLYIAQIAEKLAEDPRNISFHLATMAEYGLVAGEYREIETPTHHSAVTGKAAKFYKLTPKVDEVTKRLTSQI